MYYQSPHILEMLVKERIADYQREAAHIRRADEAERAQSGRSLRARVADSLYALAALVEGQPGLKPISATD
jgi:hypothetical protein